LHCLCHSSLQSIPQETNGSTNGSANKLTRNSANNRTDYSAAVDPPLYNGTGTIMWKSTAFAATAATIIFNLLMIYSIRQGNEEVYSNWFAIIVVSIAFLINRYAHLNNQQRQTRPEFYGILFICALSFIRLLNRMTDVPFAINSITLIVMIGAGVFL
jgi:hypothetical protein